MAHYSASSERASDAAKKSALVRYLYAMYKVDSIKTIAEREDLDMTIHIAKAIAKGLFGKGLSKKFLIENFSTPNRTHKSNDLARIDEIIIRYQNVFLQRF